ncbi:hypothetical protein SUGI_0738570 [Cryptomeria japonica]|uniref:uncharacterized protein LOC131030432 n=1 Tax=Cryptomeria japonica TaxID=3369 RepID=UPI002414CB46|nr:uncharacterized protein LOC131030432 [Cryptomeria japonica]GLJ36701.1 hypothetical protein SUGI_0738570 [Cryptomeria japonica]
MANCLRDPLLMDPCNSSSQLEDSIERIKNEWKHRRKITDWCRKHIAPQEPGERDSWRNRLGEFLESTPVHVATLILLLIDLLATAVDILKTLHNKSHDLNKCTALVESCHCVAHFQRSESLEFLYWVGIVILSLLLLNVGGLLVAFGFSFFGHPGYILDLVVLTTALCLEIFLDAQTAGLLVILTLWRIVRVAHGIFEVTDDAMESEIHNIETQFEALESNNKQMQQLLQDKDAKIAQLELQLQQSQMDT